MYGAVSMEVLLGIVLGLLAGVISTVVLLKRRHTAKVTALLGRLGELEELVDRAAGEGEPGQLATDSSYESGVFTLEQLTADVLAGRTSRVHQLIEEGAVQGLPLADQAIVRIHAHLEENLTPAELARELNVSLRSLERGLAFSLDCTPRELILALKMREARRLLESGELNVTGVAYRLGFSSPSHFSRRFRAFFKVPPSEIARRAA